MKITLSIPELEELIRVAKKAYQENALSMIDTVEIELISASTITGKSDRINANLQYGWSELGAEKVFSN